MNTLHCKQHVFAQTRTRTTFSAPDRRGAAVVELALVSPFLVLLAIGVCEVGQALKADVILSEAVRAGCSTAVRAGCSNQDVTNDINNILTTNGLSTSAASITIRINDATGEVAAANLNDKITVTVSIPASQVVIANTLKYFGVGSQLSQSLTMLKLG